MSFTPEDYDHILESNNKILVELNDLENQGWDKKKDRIKRYVDNSRILMGAGKLPVNNKKEFASYIYQKITEYTTISRNGDFYSLFKDDETKDEMSRIVEEKATNISSQDGKTVDQRFNESKEKHSRKDDEFTRFFEIIKECFKEGNTLNDAMIEKYNKSDELSKVMRDQLDLEKLVPEFIAIHATFKLARENIDDRSKWLAYHKVKAQFLCKVGETKAQLAKMMRYCSKYSSNGIERSPEVTEYWKWLGTCPKCGVDVADELTYQVKLYESGKDLTIHTPLTGY